MAAKALTERVHPKTPTVELSRATETLIRKLVAQTDRERTPLPAPKGGEPEGREVIFNGEVDGVRCLLMKSPTPGERLVPLSPREREIARMIAKGYPNKTIAAVLEISVWTVCTHLRRIFAKLGVTSRTAMVTRMVTSGLIQ